MKYDERNIRLALAYLYKEITRLRNELGAAGAWSPPPLFHDLDFILKQTNYLLEKDFTDGKAS